jgi:hypothetical protein
MRKLDAILIDRTAFRFIQNGTIFVKLGGTIDSQIFLSKQEVKELKFDKS